MEKQTKTIESKALGSVNDFSINIDDVQLEKQEKIHKLVKERAYEIIIFKQNIKPDNLVYNFKNESCLKNYLHALELYKHLRDALDDQKRFKLDLN